MSLEHSDAPDFTLDSTAGEQITLSETLDDGPTVVLVNRGHWCSFCAEQLQTFSELSYDMWFHDAVDVLPVVTDSLGDVTEMRDRFDLDVQLLADPDGEVAEQYSGVEETSHGLTGIAGTYVIDTDGVVQCEHIAATPATGPTRTSSATSFGEASKACWRFFRRAVGGSNLFSFSR